MVSARPLRRRERRRRTGHRRRCRCADARRRAPCTQTFGAVFSSGRMLSNCAHQLGRHDDVLRRHDVDAMRERLPDQVGVEQRGDAADAGDAEPDRHEFRPVRHQQADGVALCDSFAERPARIAVRALEQLPVAEGLARRTAAPVRRRCRAASSSITFGKMRAGFFAICVVMRSARSTPRRKTRSPMSWLKNPMPRLRWATRLPSKSRQPVSRGG